MASEKSPAFQFYPKDFLTDVHVVAMTMPERGVYITLLCLCWLDHSLPVDLGALAKICRLSPAALTRLWPALEPCFTVLNGRLVQPRIERERRKQEDYRTLKSEAGKQGGRPKAELKQTESRGKANESPPSPSSSSSPSSFPSAFVPSGERVLPEDLDKKWEQFKDAYPSKRREGGRMALHFFMVACQSVGFEALMAALIKHKQSKDWREGFAPGMEKWLEKTMWIQEPEPEHSSSDDVAAMQKHLAKMEADRRGH